MSVPKVAVAWAKSGGEGVCKCFVGVGAGPFVTQGSVNLPSLGGWTTLRYVASGQSSNVSFESFLVPLVPCAFHFTLLLSWEALFAVSVCGILPTKTKFKCSTKPALYL